MKVWATIRVVIAYTILVIYTLLFLIFAALTFKVGVRAYFHRFARLFGRTYLAIVGVKLDSPYQAILDQRAARVVTLNHSSQLDFFVGAAIMPPWGTVIAKREVLKIPLLGWAIAMLDLVTIDRGDPERARITMAEAADRIRDELATILIAPEGTRSRTGYLGPFKMGAFHLAHTMEVPIVILRFKTPSELQPLGTQLVYPGTVSVELLTFLEWSDIESLTPHQLRDSVREAYLIALGESP